MISKEADWKSKFGTGVDTVRLAHQTADLPAAPRRRSSKRPPERKIEAEASLVRQFDPRQFIAALEAGPGCLANYCGSFTFG